ncbi:DUF927 domain-containing protein [Roseococcus sp.]|uniref:DUF927 domain-containing protein n=1 Tax=Roseococcus sp. TaxID=2109646 RepID=UPI003BAD266A
MTQVSGGESPQKPPNKALMREALAGATPAGARSTGSRTTGGGLWRGTEVGGFEMTTEGLCRVAYDKEGKPRGSYLVSGRFDILAETRDGENEGWGLLLQWRDRDGHPHEWVLPRSMIAGEAADARARLAGGGLYLAPSPAARAAFVEFLAQQRPTHRVRTVPRVGWHFSTSEAAVFVLPHEAMGELDGETVRLELPSTPPAIYRSAGTIEDWRRDVAGRCAGNRILVLAVCCAFAGPLLTLLGETGGGVHLHGQSRRGKSTALYAAASVWGAPRGHTPFARSWRATGNALEATAAEHNDVLLPLDEIGQVEPRELGEVAYMLANGIGKGRAQREGRAKPSLTWRLLLLSTGEKRIGDVMAEAGQRTVAGQEVRLVDLPADAGKGLGAFETLHGAATPAAFAEMLDGLMRLQHGTAGPAFLRWLLPQVNADATWAPDTLRPRVLDFLGEFLPAGADGQVRSVARRFAIIGLGGELATQAGVTGWSEGEAWAAAGACFRAWLEARGSAGAREDMEAVARIRTCIAADGQSRFELWRDRSENHADVPTASDPPAEGRPVHKRLGWKRWQGDAQVHGGGFYRWLFTAEGFREVMAGLDAGAAARHLTARGFLRPGPTGTTRTAKPPGFPRGVAVYEVLGSIMSGDSDGLAEAAE